MSRSGSAPSLIPVASKRLRAIGSSRIQAIDSVSTDPAVVRLTAGLATHETRLDMAAGSLVEPFAMLRPVREEGEIVDFLYECANDAATGTSANAPEELVGTRMHAQLSSVSLFDAYVRVMETGKPLELDDFVPPGQVRGDPEQPRFDVRALRAGELLLLRWQDVTEWEHHAAEHTVLDTIVRSSDDAIMSLDVDMRITSWNLGAENVYGYRSQEILGNQATSSFQPMRRKRAGGYARWRLAAEKSSDTKRNAATPTARSLTLPSPHSPDERIRAPRGRDHDHARHHRAGPSHPRWPRAMSAIARFSTRPPTGCGGLTPMIAPITSTPGWRA